MTTRIETEDVVGRLCEMHKKMLLAVQRNRPYSPSLVLGKSDLDTVLDAAVALERAKAAATPIERLREENARVVDGELRKELLDLLELGGDYAADIFNDFRDKSSECARRVEANLERFNKARNKLAALTPSADDDK
jgi:hypothetical protein